MRGILGQNGPKQGFLRFMKNKKIFFRKNPVFKFLDQNGPRMSCFNFYEKLRLTILSGVFT